MKGLFVMSLAVIGVIGYFSLLDEKEQEQKNTPNEAKTVVTLDQVLGEMRAGKEWIKEKKEKFEDEYDFSFVDNDLVRLFIKRDEN